MSMVLQESNHFNDIQPWNQDNAQIVLVLVGLIASGKSTFAKALEQHFPEFRRCNQDDLGDRKAVEHLARSSLRQGLSVCVDRTNFDETQRQHWIRIAREFPKTRLWCIMFDTPINICTERLQSRTDHPTITSPEQGIEVLRRFKNMLVPPTANEGFERIFKVKPEGHSTAEYSREELQALLLRVATSPPPMRSAPQRGIREYFEAATPRDAQKGGNWRDRNYSRWSSGHRTSPGCGTGGSASIMRPFESRQFVTPDIVRIWPVSVRNEQAENSFQNNGCISKAAEIVKDCDSRRAFDHMVPSKQAGDGTPENPISVD